MVFNQIFDIDKIDIQNIQDESGICLIGKNHVLMNMQTMNEIKKIVDICCKNMKLKDIPQIEKYKKTIYKILGWFYILFFRPKCYLESIVRTKINIAAM